MIISNNIVVVVIFLSTITILFNTTIINGIILSSKSNSFLQLPKWISRSNSSIHFEFQTNQSNALILYIDDGGIFDFFELKLVDGSLRLRYNLGGGAQMIIVGYRLDNNQWHKVILGRNREITSLSITNLNLTQSKVTRGKDHDFGLIDNNSNLFFGGLPNSFNHKMTALSLPSVVFEPKFVGAIRNIIYTDADSYLPKRQDFRILNKKIWNNTIMDECELRDLCKNDGICITTDTDPVCECIHENYEGPFCEKEKEPSEATFKGAEFISYDLSKTKADPITSTQDSMNFYFKTKHPNGLLFFIADDNDYLNVALKDGAVILTMSLSNGKQEMLIKPKRIRFDDNQWHKIHIHRRIQELSAIVDGIYADHSHIAGKFNQISLNKIYIGGSLNTRSLPGARIHSNFNGCMRQVEYYSDGLKLNLLELGKNNNKLVTLIGRIDFKCMKEDLNDPVTFTTPKSFLTLPSWKAKKNGSISLKFRTNEQNGLLLYNGCVKSIKSEFVAIEILNGQVYVHLNLGLDSIKVRGSKRRVDDGLWHELILSRYGFEGRITVDNSQQSFSIPGKNAYMELTDALFLGGYKSNFENELISPTVWTGRLLQGFVGCVKDFYLNHNIIDLVQYAKKQDSVSIKSYCNSQSGQCASQPCRNNGICTEGWNRYTCDCSSTSFTGANCAKESITLNFNGSQYMQILMNQEQITQTEQLVFRFKTIKASGLLLSTESVHTNDKIELTLVHSRIRLFIAISDKQKELVAGKNLNDDQWHTIKFARFANNIKLQLDSYSPIRGALIDTSENLNNKHYLLHMNRISLAGNSPDENGVLKSSTNYNFIGSMQQFVFNGHHFMELSKFSKNKCVFKHFPCIKTTATFSESAPDTIRSPVTFGSQQAFIGLPTLNAYSTILINLMFKTRESNALILYNKGHKDDYVALELSQGHISYIISIGRETIHLRDTIPAKLNDNRWHKVNIRRFHGAHILMVDGNLVSTVSSDDKYLELDGIFYVSGVRKDIYSQLPITINSRVGFEGCLANLDVADESIDLLSDAIVHSSSIRSGCQNEPEKCAQNICENHGLCIQQWQTNICNCDMTSYSGPTCSKESISYEFGPNRGIIIFSFPDEKRPETSEDQIAFGFMTTRSNAILLLISSDYSKDYLQIELVDGNIFVLFNVGSNDHVIEEVYSKLNDNNYHVIRFNRLGSNASLQIDDFPIQSVHRFGQQLHIFNSQSQIQIGGKWNPNKSRIERPFFGIISGLVINGLRVLDLAANGNTQISTRGEVQKVESISNRQESLSFKMQQTPASSFPGISDELVVSGGGSDCVDDEDQCVPSPDSIGSGDDDLITPVYVPTKKPQLTTPRSTKTGNDIRLCDDEDCFEGSGLNEVSIEVPMTNLTVNTNMTTNNKVSITISQSPPYFNTTIDRSSQMITTEIARTFPMKPFTSMAATTTTTTTSTTTTTTTTTTSTTTTSTTEKPITLKPPFRKLDYFTDYPKIIYNNLPYYPPISTRPPPRRRPERVTSELSEVVALIIGIISGTLIAVILIIILILKFKSRNNVAYKMRGCNDTQGQNASLLGTTESNSSRQVQYQMNGTNANVRPKKRDSKDVKEWYV